MLDWPDDFASLSLEVDAPPAKVETVARHLGRVLNWGGLAFFIGAGISKVVDLPMWKELNAKIVEKAPLVLAARFPEIWRDAFAERLPNADDVEGHDDVSEEMDRIERVCSECETLASHGVEKDDKLIGTAPSWHEIVRQALYEEATRYDFKAMFHPELVSLCSLMMGSRRGHIREVVTFNYDDLIQSYLTLQGHLCNVVSPLPFRLSPNSGTTFYHPHGYLPLQDEQDRESPFIVLSEQSFRQVRSGMNDHASDWRRLIASILSMRVGLFVGISGKDKILELYFDEAQKLARKLKDGRPLAFAIIIGNDNRSVEDWLRDKIVPLEFSSPNEVARFLAQICQQAALLVPSSAG